MLKRHLALLLGIMIVALVFVGPARADDLEQIKAQMQAMNDRIKQLEAERDQMTGRVKQLETERAEPGASLVMAAQKQNGSGLATGSSLKQDIGKGEGLRLLDTEKSKVRVYGLLDMTLFRYMNNQAKDGSGKFGMPVSWFSGNRWGIDASQGIGGGFNVIAKLESEFEMPTGNMDTGNVLFNRDAWIGVQSAEFGKFTIGRQNTLPRDFSQQFGDPFGSWDIKYSEGGWTNNNNFKQLIYYTGGGYGSNGDGTTKTGNTRLDNGFVYKKIFKNGLVVGAAFAFGDQLDSSGGANGFDDPAAGTVKSVAVGYNAPSKKFNLGAFYNTTDVLGGKLYGTSTDRGFTHQSLGVGGNYTFTKWLRWNAGYFYYTADQNPKIGQRHDNAWTTSFKFSPQKKVDYYLGIQSMHASNAAVSKGNILNAYADASGATTVATGTRRNYYGAVMYHPVSTLDVYFAADFLKLYDGYGYSATNGHSNLFECAPGIRWRF